MLTSTSAYTDKTNKQSINGNSFSHHLLDQLYKEGKHAYTELTDEFLAKLYINKKDEEALNEIAFRYIDKIYRLALSITKNSSDAEDVLQNISLTLLDNYYLALEHIAELNAVTGNYEQAIKVYNQVLEINPNPDFYIALAGIFAKQGNQDKANELYEIAKGKYETYLNNGFNGYLGHHAQFYADSEIDLQKALHLAKKDLEIKKDVHAFDTLAWAYYKLGNYEEALSYSRVSLNQGTKDAGIYFHAGMINYKAGNFSDAKKYLDLSLKTNPYFDMNSPDQAKAAIKQISLAQ